MSTDRQQIERQLALFFGIWAVVVFYDRAVRGTSDTWWSVAIVLAAAALALKPRSVPRVTVLALVHFAWYIRGYAARADIHWHIAAMMHLALLLAIGVGAMRARGWPKLVDLYPAVAPVARWVFVIELYSAGFAKLNTGFLDPALSCGVALLEFQRTAFPYSLLPGGPVVQWSAIIGTLIAELGTPLLLLFRVTRPLGFLVAFGFFWCVGTNPVAHLFEFTGEFLAMSVFFASPALVAAGADALRPVWRPLSVVGRGRWRWPILGIAVVLSGVLIFGSGQWNLRDQRLELCRAVYVVALGMLAAGYVFGLWRVGTRGPRLPLLPSPILLAFIPLIFLVGETSTYIGLKHVPTMTMAGNNATSTAYSNHILVNPVPAFAFNRVVRVQQSSDKRLKAGTELVWLAFSDWVARHPRAAVDYLLEGRLEHVVPATGAVREDPRFETSVWPVLLRLDSQVFPRHSPDCGHRLGEKP